MDRVLILLKHGENGRLLAEWLEARYEVMQPDPLALPDAEFDLAVVDAPALAALTDAIRHRRESEARQFLPFLLVSARQDLGMITQHPWQTVDELLLTPIEKLELQARIEVLLRARRQSLELRQSDEFLRTVVTNAPLALFAIDRSREISVAEGRILDLLDIRCGGSMAAVFHDRPEALKAVDRALCGERVNVSLEREGRAFEVHLAPNLLRDEVIGVVGVAVDVTERRTLEERLRSQYQQLQELNRLKNDFVNAVSHDLRTPLTTIIGYVEFLEEGLGGALTPEQTQFVDQIRSSGTRLSGLVNDLLDFARAEAGTFTLQVVEAIDFSRLVRDVTASLRPQAEAAGLTVEIDLPPAPMVLSLDRKRIERVITNLLHNAIKFTPPGGSIRISATQDGDLVHVEIADTGIGIEPQDVPKLFHSFVQLEDAARKVGGSGLGLSISKTFVEAHGGSIGVRSTPGAGSTFWFTLPQSRSPAGSSSTPSAPGQNA